jgi:hypothetical protein
MIACVAGSSIISISVAYMLDNLLATGTTSRTRASAHKQRVYSHEAEQRKHVPAERADVGDVQVELLHATLQHTPELQGEREGDFHCETRRLMGME